MNISIEYCMEWNYEPRALSLRDVLQKEYPNTEIKLIPSSGGVFEIMINGHLNVFSKRKTGRFPISEYEVVKTISDAITERRVN